jgi:hypothetical protein
MTTPERCASPDWGVAVFVNRETDSVVARTLESIARAATGASVTLDVLVNGNPGLAGSLAVTLAASRPDAAARLRLWSIRLGDKAHAWNEYVHKIWSGSEIAFNVDGYARPEANALLLLAQRLAASDVALAASGTPSAGRSSGALRREMATEGGLHGNLFALHARAMTQMRERGFRLPLGLYRTDATIGAALAFGLDPGRHEWQPKTFILADPEASWQTDPKRWWLYSDIRSQAKRVVRQAQGAMENMAVRDCLAIRRMPAEQLPRVASEMIFAWMAREPAQARALLRRRPLCRLALRQLRDPRDWSAASADPSLLLDLPPARR